MSTLRAISPLVLRGLGAFYRKEEYFNGNEEALVAGRAPDPSFSWSNRTLIQRVAGVAFLFFSIIIFPIGLYQLFHAFIGKNFVVRAATTPEADVTHEIDLLRKSGFEMGDGLIYKRFCIKVNGKKIDGMIVGTLETLENSDTWFIHGNGQGAFYEQEVNGCDDFKGHLRNLGANGIVFNYAGVGRSSGSITRENVIESTHAIIDLVTNKTVGFGAKKVYAWGHSLGSATLLQAFVRAFDSLRSREDLSVVLALSRSFSTFSTAVEEFTGSGFLSTIIRRANWELDSFTASKRLERFPQIHQVILQTTLPAELNYQRIANPNRIIFDGVITSPASLARKHLMALSERNKTILAMKETHNAALIDGAALDRILAQKMEEVENRALVAENRERA